jgi:hypothetical protein
MVDLDSDPTKLLEVVEIGKQLLVTRGALTTFSLANDVAKYFAILPALFAGALPGLAALDVLQLHSPTTAVLSAVIVNALLIPLLVPLALRGVACEPMSADALLTRNLALWGGGPPHAVRAHQGRGRRPHGRGGLVTALSVFTSSVRHGPARAPGGARLAARHHPRLWGSCSRTRRPAAWWCATGASWAPRSSGRPSPGPATCTAGRRRPATIPRAAAGSNLAASNPALRERVADRGWPRSGGGPPRCPTPWPRRVRAWTLT